MKVRLCMDVSLFGVKPVTNIVTSVNPKRSHVLGTV